MISLHNPAALFLLLVFPLYAVLQKAGCKKIIFAFSILDWKTDRKVKNKNILYSVYRFEYIAALIFIITALAEPNLISQNKTFADNDASVMFLLDVSPSMSITDMHNELDNTSSRLDIAKETIRNFVLQNKNIAIGLTLFATHSSLVIPETLNRNIFLQRLENVTVGELGEGTALGDGLATALLHSRRDANCYLVVLTDGENNAGSVSPINAAKIIAERAINFYVIGIGSTEGGEIQYHNAENLKTYYGKSRGHFNEAKLKELAQYANGVYHAAHSTETLHIGFDTIHKNLAKTVLQETITEMHPLQKYAIAAAFILLTSAWYIKKNILRMML